MDENAAERGTAKVIAGTYELREQIGAGSAGVVYLARHMRLDKDVVLKADKRTLSADREALRREVDALKNLSHTYIPQVYDFVVEDGTVYTVMDYIEGESLDRPLKRGELFSQAQVIEWGCELLEALRYLHSRPPHGILHGDVKPSNIMLTPQNEIRLIDFNIALALKEEGAVRVGRSAGYASPEHYGMSFSQKDGGSGSSSGSTSGSRGSVRLDVRSDIYGLGATLYHLLTGVRPNANARLVTPISSQDVSPAVASIIQKAMAPDPEQRYQTAQEMLEAFERLYIDDPRAKRHRRQCAAAAGVLAAMLLVGGACTFAGLRQMQQEEKLARLEAQAAQEAEEAARLEAEEAEEAERQANEALEAITGSESAFQAGDPGEAAELALSALEMDTPYNVRAQKALTDALGVYDLTDGFKARHALTLPSEPQKVQMSPRGTRVAAMTGDSMSVYDTESGERLALLAKDASALADVAFPSENVVVYPGPGALRAYDLEAQVELWSGLPATAISVSADGSTVAAVYRDETHATIYDASTGDVKGQVDFHGLSQQVMANDVFSDQEHNLFALNGNGELLAVSFENGALWVFDLQDSRRDVEIYDRSDHVHFEGGFNSKFFAFCSTSPGGDDSLFAVLDLERLAQTVCYQNTVPFHVQADESGIYVATGHTLVRIDTQTWEDMEVAYSEGAAIASFCKSEPFTVVLLQDNTYAFYNGAAEQVEVIESAATAGFARVAGGFAAIAGRDEATLRVLRLENYPQAQYFTYDGSIEHSEARVSADGQTVMLFRYNKLWLYTIEGSELAQVEFPDPGDVYDTQYRRDESGSYLEVIYNSGLVRSYSAADGSLLSERLDEAPDRTFEEEFYTDGYRIVSPLHGTPTVYDRDSGEEVCKLESDDFLTYVTQVDDMIVTEYITAEGERYGLLLNEDCETLAELPDLCDITEDGTLIFDDMQGNLRQSRIYTADELKALATSEEEKK